METMKVMKSMKAIKTMKTKKAIKRVRTIKAMKMMKAPKQAQSSAPSHADVQLLRDPYSSFFRELYNSRHRLRPLMHAQASN